MSALYKSFTYLLTSVFMVSYIFIFFVKFFTLPFSELSLVGLALDLTIFL